MHGCLDVCVCALRTVPTDKTLRFINTLMIIIFKYKVGNANPFGTHYNYSGVKQTVNPSGIHCI